MKILMVFQSIYEVYDIHYAPLAVYNADTDTSKNLIRKLNAWFTGKGVHLIIEKI